jgi:hypothetical protein
LLRIHRRRLTRGNPKEVRIKASNLIIKTASPLVQNIALCGGTGQKPAWV